MGVGRQVSRWMGERKAGVGRRPLYNNGKAVATVPLQLFFLKKKKKKKNWAGDTVGQNRLQHWRTKCPQRKGDEIQTKMEKIASRRCPAGHYRGGVISSARCVDVVRIGRTSRIFSNLHLRPSQKWTLGHGGKKKRTIFFLANSSFLTAEIEKDEGFVCWLCSSVLPRPLAPRLSLPSFLSLLLTPPLTSSPTIQLWLTNGPGPHGDGDFFLYCTLHNVNRAGMHANRHFCPACSLPPPLVHFL